MIKNKLDKSFGAGGSSTGLFLFIAGLATTYYSLIGIVFIICGAFIGFTFTCSIIDISKKRIKFTTYLFGIFSTGKWIDIKSDMKLGIKKSNIGQRISSRGSSLDIYNKDFRIILCGIDNKQIVPIKKFDTIESAKKELETLTLQLGLARI